MSSLHKLSTPLFIASGIAAIAYAGTCLALYHYQTNLIFRPLPLLISTPAEVGLTYEDIWLSLPNISEKLHGWWMPNPASNRTLLLCHGNYGNVSYNVNRCHFVTTQAEGVSKACCQKRGRRVSPGHPGPACAPLIESREYDRIL